jgi:3-dehydroquinate synthase
MKVHEALTQRPCPIYIDEHLLFSQSLMDCCKDTSSQHVIITDDNVGPLYAAPLQSHLEKHNVCSHRVTIPCGEASKTREVAFSIQDQLFELGCGRDTVIIALGGGVITDLAGFVAATYCRGVPVIYLPTTLLGMVDAAIGGKTGVNTAYGKNLIGVFAQPKAVFSDINTLSTLPESEYITAFSEIVKHALIYDEDYFDFLFNNTIKLKSRDPALLKVVIEKSCVIKSRIVEIDEREAGLRAICNFGHTIAHALEYVTDYHMRHGKAVAIGILVESYMACEIGMLSVSDFRRIREIIDLLSIPLSIDCSIKLGDIKKAVVLDKKSRAKKPRFVMLKRIGETHLHDSKHTMPVDDKIVDMALSYLMRGCVE